MKYIYTPDPKIPVVYIEATILRYSEEGKVAILSDSNGVVAILGIEGSVILAESKKFGVPNE